MTESTWISLDSLQSALRKYDRSPTLSEQRVGQFLMNELLPSNTDPEIFYATDRCRGDREKIVQKFMDRYCELGENWWIWKGSD